VNFELALRPGNGQRSAQHVVRQLTHTTVNNDFIVLRVRIEWCRQFESCALCHAELTGISAEIGFMVLCADNVDNSLTIK
jgi:hypothetical protein